MTGDALACRAPSTTAHVIPRRDAAVGNRRAAALLLSLALVGCASPLVDRAILLPGQAGRPTGALEVTTASGARLRLDKPFAEARVRRDGSLEPATSSSADIQARYGSWLALQPPLPRTWTIEFDSGALRLPADALPVLEEIRQAVATTPAAELIVTGHTDRVGSVADNDRLSLARAQALRDELVARGFDAARIRVAGRGEREPRVPTADEVAEPRNRRVEIKLR